MPGFEKSRKEEIKAADKTSPARVKKLLIMFPIKKAHAKIDTKKTRKRLLFERVNGFASLLMSFWGEDLFFIFCLLEKLIKLF